MATPRCKLNSLHYSRSQMCSITYPQVVSPQFVHPAPSTYVLPSAPLVSNHEYTSGLIVRRATAWTVAGTKLSGVVWVWDDTQSSTAESQALKEA